MKEGNLVKRIRVAGSKLGAVLFRNNTGRGWVGRLERSGMPHRLLIFDPRPLDAGLVKGSSDLIGWTRVKITEEMVGETIAVFTAIEVKTGKQKMSGPQSIFVGNVIDAGGLAGVARSVEDAEEILETHV